MPTSPSLLPEFGPRTAATDEVPAYLSPRGTTWHTRWECPPLRRTQASALTWEGPAGEAELRLGDPSGRYRRNPCPQCALEVVSDLAVRSARSCQHTTAGPGGRGTLREVCDCAVRRVVLACAFDARDIPDGHVRCLHCARLRDLARRHDLAGHTAAAGYQLVAATIREEATVTLRNVYALHAVPTEVATITTDLLRVAWALRPARTGAPVVRRPGQRWLTPADQLAWTQADLVTASPATRVRESA